MNSDMLVVRGNQSLYAVQSELQKHESLPEQTQVETIAALAEVILQVWEMNAPMDKPSEDKIDE